MTQTGQALYFRRARAGQGPCLYVAASYDRVLREHDQFFQSSCLLQYVPSEDRWFKHDLAQYITSICPTTLPGDTGETLVALSAEGEVTLNKGLESQAEQITGAGLHNDDHRGRMFGIRRVGQRLFACGEGGQLYRRDEPGRWTLLDPALLPEDSSSAMEELDRNADDITKLLAVDLSGVVLDARRKTFVSVNGLDENNLYACGYDGSLVFWDGEHARWVSRTPSAQLLSILVSPERGVWVSGSDGTLLLGNPDGDFKAMSISSDLTLNSMTWFQDRLWLTANGGFGGPHGVFTFETGRLVRASSGLMPDFDDVHSIDAVDGMLWVVGARDILCFDGRSWKRIDHPDNLPVR